jgi:hypothetical protein
MDTCPLAVICFNKKLKADSLTPELLYLYLQILIIQTESYGRKETKNFIVRR